jgi:hypothetical protein
MFLCRFKEDNDIVNISFIIPRIKKEFIVYKSLSESKAVLKSYKRNFKNF